VGVRHKDGYYGIIRQHPALEAQAGLAYVPRKDGGTCINEAAIVAAGFPYQPVGTVEDMPACFSRPICRLALRMNDAATDDERQQLLPFVTRLACADTPEIEQEREAYIVSRMRYRFSFQNDLEVLEGALAIGRQGRLACARGGED
jgi:hypothetical protein